jgi:L-rhamnose mutarotase
MERACFLLQVKKDRLADYLKAHDVWPEMRQAIHASGIRNYSMFYRPDGLLVGYLEGENIRESLRKAGQTDVNARWQAHMAEFFESGSGDMQKGGLEWLSPYFFEP